MAEHALIVHFTYGNTDLGPLFDLEDDLITAIEAADAGEYDGNDMAVDGSDGTLYMYGPDADKLFAVVKPLLESTTFLRGAQVTLRYGPPDEDVEEVQINLSD